MAELELPNGYGNGPLFRELTAEDVGDLETTEIESLCMNCHEDGTTRLLLTKIPFFREIVLMSFSCPHCNFTDNEVQPAGRIQDKGCRVDVHILNQQDLNRQVVKSDTASIKIPELDLEIPGGAQKGSFTTVEGIIDRVTQGLEQEQPVRKIMHPDVAAQIDDFIVKLKHLSPPFHIILDDPAGNSFIENPKAPEADQALTINMYTRSKEQNTALGLAVEDDEDRLSDVEETLEPKDDGVSKVTDEVFQFDVNCSNCNAPTKSKMKLVNIPHFKEVILMAFNCESCGMKDSEVKSGAGIEPKGKKVTLKMTDAVMDLNRDVLKSDTCRFTIPEMDFELMMGTLGGKFTTLEGLLTDIKNQLLRPFALMRGGDSATKESGGKLRTFIDKLDEIISGKILVSVVLDDPAGNCYIQNLYAPDPDPELMVEEYERTEEQNDDLGLLEMKTENYCDGEDTAS
ncbi:zinc finger protein ZPR1-like [Asterias amurensis]|uniref:zinc finger protein ZPR1-like n=1 Tax=Asterias amurensis TaxID=7602 RepID=UPI003AB15C41